MVFGGPPGIIAGAAIMSAGIGGVTNSVSQAKDDTQEDFSFGKFAGHVVVNGIAGAATGGAGAAFQTAGRLAQFGVSVGTAAVSGSGTQIASNAINGKEDILEGAGTALLTGALSGGIASGAATGAGAIMKDAMKGASEGIKVTAKVAAGALGGGTASSLSTIVQNLITKGKMSKIDLRKLLCDHYRFS